MHAKNCLPISRCLYRHAYTHTHTYMCILEKVCMCTHRVSMCSDLSYLKVMVTLFLSLSLSLSLSIYIYIYIWMEPLAPYIKMYCLS